MKIINTATHETLATIMTNHRMTLDEACRMMDIKVLQTQEDYENHAGYDVEELDLIDETEIDELKKKFDGKFVTNEEFREIELSPYVVNVEHLGYSGLHIGATWYLVQFVDGDEMSIYDRTILGGVEK